MNEDRAEMFAKKQAQETQINKFARAIFYERYDTPYYHIPWVLNAARAVQRIVEESTK